MVRAKADIATIPVYARAGSILPLGPVKQYADEKSDAPTELRIYPGKDGTFELYDDEGDGYGYEQGRYASIRLTWNDKQRRLDFAERKGTYPGMQQKQAFRLVCGAGKPVAKAPAVVYTGQAMSAALPKCA